jgi:carbonic anhydrase
MQKISDETIAKLLEDDLETASFDGKSWSNNKNLSENSKPGSKEGHKINWYTFSSLKQSMAEDLEIIKNHNLIPSNIKIHGFIYEVSLGKLIKIEDYK